MHLSLLYPRIRHSTCNVIFARTRTTGPQCLLSLISYRVLGRARLCTNVQVTFLSPCATIAMTMNSASQRGRDHDAPLGSSALGRDRSPATTASHFLRELFRLAGQKTGKTVFARTSAPDGPPQAPIFAAARHQNVPASPPLANARLPRAQPKGRTAVAVRRPRITSFLIYGTAIKNPRIPFSINEYKLLIYGKPLPQLLQPDRSGANTPSGIKSVNQSPFRSILNRGTASSFNNLLDMRRFV
jgi:hypothetical protein